MIKYHAVMLKPALVVTREHAGVNCQFLNEVCRTGGDGLYAMTSLHGLSLSKRPPLSRIVCSSHQDP